MGIVLLVLLLFITIPGIGCILWPVSTHHRSEKLVPFRHCQMQRQFLTPLKGSNENNIKSQEERGGGDGEGTH